MHALRASTLALALAAATAGGQASILPSVGNLQWMAGSWCGGPADERVEETWLSPASGQMLGMSRTLRPGKEPGFEFLRIEQRGAVPTYVAQPGGRAPVEFPMSASGPDWIRFENPSHDFPRRIEYRREGAALIAEVSGPADAGEDPVRLRYEACGAG